MERKRESLLTNVLKQEEWKSILDYHFEQYDPQLREFILKLKVSTNRGLPLPTGPNPRILITVVNKHVRDLGFVLEEVQPDAHQVRPKLRLYRLVRKKK